MPRILEKTGIYQRFISAGGETAVDLAFEAGKKLLADISGREEIDLLILVTQSPDYVLPTSACILQDRLGLSDRCLAFDVNLGCSGFVSALGIAGGLIESGVATKGLILCADTYTKYIDKHDRTCRPLFSDGAAATLLERSDRDGIGPFDFGTDGSGHDCLIVRGSGAREASQVTGSCRGRLEMRGSDVFLFTMRSSCRPASSDSSIARGLGSTTSTCSCSTRPAGSSWKILCGPCRWTRTRSSQIMRTSATPCRHPSRLH